MATAMKAFKRFLASESVTIDGRNPSILDHPSGACFVAVKEKFAMHLTYLTGGNKELLAKDCVISYYREVKKWLLGFFTLQRTIVDSRLLKMAHRLEKHCLTRVRGASKEGCIVYER